METLLVNILKKILPIAAFLVSCGTGEEARERRRLGAKKRKVQNQETSSNRQNTTGSKVIENVSRKTGEEPLKDFVRGSKSQEKIYHRAEEYCRNIEEGKRAFKVTVVTGAPGVGKTFIASLLRKYANQKGREVLCQEQGNLAGSGEKQKPFLVVFDDFSFDIEKDTSLTADSQRIIAPRNLNFLAQWLDYCKKKKIHLWISSNVENFPEYIRKVNQALYPFRKKWYAQKGEYWHTLFSTFEMMEKDASGTFCSVEVEAENRREGLVALLGGEETKPFSQKELDETIARFEKGKEGTLNEAGKGGIVFVPEEVKNTCTFGYELNDSDAEGALIIENRDKGRTVFFLKYDEEQFGWLYRTCFEYGFLLVVRTPKGVDPKAFIEGLKEKYRTEGSTRSKNVGYIDRLEKCVLYRV